MKTYGRIDPGFIFKLLLFCILAYFPFFLDLGALPIRVWDESRVAVNAYEMGKSGHWFVSTYLWQPDMWNTKPPLLLWLQVLFSKPLGMGELAIRLPSAIAGFLTAAALVLFLKRFAISFWFGMIAALVLMTSFGYVGLHATRTGDYDALLALFTTLYPILFFLFLDEKKKKFLHLFFLAFILAVMTKGIQALIFLPALFIFAIIRKEFLMLMKEKWMYIGFFACIVFIGGYYLLRDHYNPGYIKAVWLNEVGGRYSSPVEGHHGDAWFYFDSIVGYAFSGWHWLVPCGMSIGFFIRNSMIRKLTLFTTLLVIFYFGVISFGGTKLEWYEVPLFPFLSILASIPLYYIFGLLKNSHRINRQFSFNVMPYLFLFIVFLMPYSRIIQKVYKPEENDVEKEFYQMSYYLRDALKSGYDVKDHYVCFDGYTMQLQLYLDLLSDRSQNVGIKNWQDLEPCDPVIASQANVQKEIEGRYDAEITEHTGTTKKYIIHGPKPAS
jgi:4-amino-4-deoxy-L-arabinose transferase-like glycosyltransferase